MSKDLDKLMGKLQKSKVEEVPQETEEYVESEDEEDEVDQGVDEDEDQEVPTPAPAQVIKEIPKVDDFKVKVPAQNEVPQENPIESEVGLLQNDGVFRRELLLTLKELVDVQKIQAELLIKLAKDKQ